MPTGPAIVQILGVPQRPKCSRLSAPRGACGRWWKLEEAEPRGKSFGHVLGGDSGTQASLLLFSTSEKQEEQFGSMPLTIMSNLS